MFIGQVMSQGFFFFFLANIVGYFTMKSVKLGQWGEEVLMKANTGGSKTFGNRQFGKITKKCFSK